MSKLLTDALEAIGKTDLHKGANRCRSCGDPSSDCDVVCDGRLAREALAAHRASSLVDDADAVTAIANMIAAGRNTGKEPRSTAITIAGWLDAVNGRGQR